MSDKCYRTQVIRNNCSGIICRCLTVTMDDTAKRGGLHTSELFTVILCGPDFAVF